MNLQPSLLSGVVGQGAVLVSTCTMPNSVCWAEQEMQ